MWKIILEVSSCFNQSGISHRKWNSVTAVITLAGFFSIFWLRFVLTNFPLEMPGSLGIFHSTNKQNILLDWFQFSGLVWISHKSIWAAADSYVWGTLHKPSRSPLCTPSQSANQQLELIKPNCFSHGLWSAVIGPENVWNYRNFENKFPTSQRSTLSRCLSLLTVQESLKWGHIKSFLKITGSFVTTLVCFYAQKDQNAKLWKMEGFHEINCNLYSKGKVCSVTSLWS